jgi:hypothetical protein
MKPDAVPRVGAFWFSEDMSQRVYFCGQSAEGVYVFQDQYGNFETMDGVDWSGWHHEPECDGFGWVKRSRYYVPIDTARAAYIRRDSKYRFTIVLIDGTDGNSYDWIEGDYTTELTESEALARIAKPVEVVADKAVVDPGEGYRLLGDDEIVLATDDREYGDCSTLEWDRKAGECIWFRDGRTVAEFKASSGSIHDLLIRRRIPTCTMCNGPADLTDDSCKACHELTMAKITQPDEDPDEWVTQDRTYLRKGDRWRWSSWPDGRWEVATTEFKCNRHGQPSSDTGVSMSVECRRRDLPPLPTPEPPKPAALPECWCMPCDVVRRPETIVLSTTCHH